ncbi:MAG: hypothetical protein AAF449_00765 [Myxococcota bacterium]
MRRLAVAVVVALGVVPAGVAADEAYEGRWSVDPTDCATDNWQRTTAIDVDRSDVTEHRPFAIFVSSADVSIECDASAPNKVVDGGWVAFDAMCHADDFVNLQSTVGLATEGDDLVVELRSESRVWFSATAARCE